MVGVVVVSNEEELKHKVRELKREANYNHFTEDDVSVNCVMVERNKAVQLLNDLEKNCDYNIGYFKRLKKIIEKQRVDFFEQTHK